MSVICNLVSFFVAFFSQNVNKLRFELFEFWDMVLQHGRLCAVLCSYISTSFVMSGLSMNGTFYGFLDERGNDAASGYLGHYKFPNFRGNHPKFFSKARIPFNFWNTFVKCIADLLEETSLENTGGVFVNWVVNVKVRPGPEVWEVEPSQNIHWGTVLCWKNLHSSFEVLRFRWRHAFIMNNPLHFKSGVGLDAFEWTHGNMFELERVHIQVHSGNKHLIVNHLEIRGLI